MDDKKFVTPFRMHEDVVYLAEMEIGVQQQKQYLIIDTGSSLVWTQCDECPRCHVGKVPPYGRSQSRTFQEVSYGDNDKEEEAIASYYPAKTPGYITLCINGRCMFKALYNLSGQGETVQGCMSMDTFRFIDDRRYDYQAMFRMVFGCAHQERIALTTVKDYTGILGLGMGDTEITSFSYCPPPRMPSISRRDSWLRFGSHAQISGKKVPLVMRWGKYYLPLTAITYKYNILMSPVHVIAYKSQEDYLHMMVDTGTSLLNRPSSLHDDLLKEIDAIIKSENVVKAGTSSWPRHCYLGTMDKVKDITVTLSFDEGLDIELFTSALFVESQTKDGKPVVCVALNRVDDSSEAILSMLAQTTINVGDMLMLMLIHDKDQLAPMSREAECGFSLPIVHERPLAPSMDDENFKSPFRMHEDVVYLAEMEIGEQQQKQYLMIDIGSSLVWTQCDEYPRYHVGNEVSCGDNDKEEEAIASYYPAKPPRYITLCINGRCMFKALYNLFGQGETVQGYMSMDTFRFIDDRRYDYQAKFRMVFGCAHQERIALTTVKDCTVILGLGMGDGSFLCQTGITRFSYCAPPRMPSISRRDSWLRFGSHAQISGKKVPLVMRWGKYYLPLTAITYKYNILMFPLHVIAYKSREDYLHMRVDTGTSLLNLPSSLHDDLLKEIDAIIKSENVVKAGTSSWPRHCYLGTMDKVKDITVTLCFDEGLDIELFTSALFIESQTKDGKPVVCVAVNRVDDSSEAILSMLAQTTINVGYNLLRGEIVMDPIRCAR
uniref:Peptidase A1 domain-containing protein n=1 Tax=Oryza punctata TaxID=4537 RepID=A0A0E0LSD8_ORYPU